MIYGQGDNTVCNEWPDVHGLPRQERFNFNPPVQLLAHLQKNPEKRLKSDIVFHKIEVNIDWTWNINQQHI